MNDKQKYLDEIKRLREHIDPVDPSMTFFLVRDWEYTKQAGLDELCWAAQRTTVSKNEAEWILDLLEKHIEAAL